LQQLLCGIACQTTSGLKIVSHILGALFSPGLVLIAVALLANKKPNLFFLSQFKSLKQYNLYAITKLKHMQAESRKGAVKET
jgi:lipopolysaccharide/colanic/teichoic acid biosynthesis glycosyltransferase